MHPKLTDQAVGDLPLSHGRADLLEEIMRTPVLDVTQTDRAAGTGRHGRWLVPLAAAATVAALASVPTWWTTGGEDPGEPGRRAVADGPSAPSSAELSAEPSASASAEPSGPRTGHLAVLDGGGWTVENVERSGGYGSISYSRGRAWFEVTWYPASSYESYVQDREHIVEPPAPGEPVEVLGAAGQLWPYSAQDHTVIREVQDGHWMEIRGGGIGRPEYLDLLASLRLVDEAGFETALPEEFVTGGERGAEVRRILDEIIAESGAQPYDGAAPIRSGEADPYHLGVDVAGGYACGWITAYADAVAGGDDELADQAVEVLGTAREWPVLQRMDERGDYPEVLWEYADQVAAGQVPDGYQGGLGCG
jgi:hypothetical protein